MSHFEKALKEVLKIEKGYVDSQFDNGGKTKYGISQKAYPDLDIKNLTLEQAIYIYKRDYWDTRNMKLSNIPDEKIAIELFDTAVNMGVSISATFLQKALNLCNRNQRLFKDLDVDGDIGQKTMIAYDKIDKNVLLKVLNGLQFERYKKIVENDPEQEMNFVGWMSRI